MPICDDFLSSFSTLIGIYFQEMQASSTFQKSFKCTQMKYIKIYIDLNSLWIFHIFLKDE